MTTSRSSPAALSNACSPAYFDRSYAGAWPPIVRGPVSSSDGPHFSRSKACTEEQCTTRSTPASRAALATLAGPSTLTFRTSPVGSPTIEIIAAR
nr:hypothetical protein [Candidatus Microthrix sp.]